MERLTEKMNNEHYQYKCSINCFEYGDGDLEIFDKLGKLEDIEGELGISLEVLFKALKDGIYYKDYEFEDEPPYVYYAEVDLDYCCDGWCLLRSGWDTYYLKDYGKTWALTREELE